MYQLALLYSNCFQFFIFILFLPHLINGLFLSGFYWVQQNLAIGIGQWNRNIAVIGMECTRRRLAISFCLYTSSKLMI